jgi:hypothetical protein
VGEEEWRWAVQEQQRWHHLLKFPNVQLEHLRLKEALEEVELLRGWRVSDTVQISGVNGC